MLTGDAPKDRSRPRPSRLRWPRRGPFSAPHLVAVLAAVAAAAPAPAAAPGDEAAPLAVERPQLVDEFRGERSYRLPLAGEGFVLLLVEQRGTDVAVEVADAAGRSLAAVDRNPHPWAEELVALVADAGGSFHVRLASVGEAAGGYRLTLLEARPSRRGDDQRLQAEGWFAEALVREAEDDEAASRAALDLFTRAAASFAALGLPLRQAEALHRQGALLRGLGDPERALAAFGEALGLRRGRAPVWVVAATHGQLGRTLAAAGDAERSLAELETARRLIADALAAHPGETRAQEVAGSIYTDLASYAYERGDAATARDHCRRASAAYAAAGDLKGVATVQMNLGVLHGYLGENEAAIAAYTEADEIAQRIRYEGLGPTLLLNLGSRLRAAGRLEEAVDKLQRSLEGYEERGDVEGVQAAIAHLGAAYAQLGDNERSRRFQDRALAIAEARGWRRNAAMAHINLGWLANIDDDDRAALASFETAAALVADEEGWRFHRAWAALGIGTSLIELDEPRAALPHLQTALAESRLAQSVTSESEAQRKLGLAHLALGDLAAAEAALGEALRLAGSDQPRRGATLGQLARLAERRGDLATARRHVEEAIAIRESLRAQVTSDELRASFLARWRDDYALLIDLLLRLGAAQPGQALAAEALAVSERARSRVLHELLTEARLAARSGLPDALAARQREVETRLSRIQHELFRQGGGDVERLRRELAAAQEERSQLERQIRATAPRYADLHYPQPLTLSAIQALLPAGSALVEYALGEPRSYLFVVTREHFEVHELASAATLAAAVGAARQALQRPLPFLWPQQAEQLHELYRLLLQPAERSLAAVDELLIAPDQGLYYLPFEALPSRPPRGREPAQLAEDSVLARWAVTYVPSATVYAGLPTPAGGDDDRLGLLAFADPTGGGEVPGGGSRDGDARWPPLPGTRSEVRAIAELFAADRVELFEGVEASERRVKTLPSLATARRLHFASHGLLDEQQPAYSGLVLAAEEDGSEDGLLQVREIFDLAIDAELVVLSACDSGLGKQVQGEGLIGLSRAFFYAGAPTLVVSLWQVTDSSTPELMTHFYRQVAAGGSPSRALRAAKLAMIRGGAWSHPNFWAPFIVLGRP